MSTDLQRVAVALLLALVVALLRVALPEVAPASREAASRAPGGGLATG